MHINSPSLRCSDSGGRTPSARSTAASLAGESRHVDSIRQLDDEGFTLSPEERSLVALLVAGYTKKEMARHFALSESTIYRRTVRVFGKLGAANRFELVLAAIFHRISGAA